MYGLDQLTQATEPVELAGKSYPVRQLKLSEWGQLQAWLKSVCPSPLAQAAKAIMDLESQGESVPEAIRDALFRQAQEESRRWPPRVGSGAWLKALEDIETGRSRFIQSALAAGGTDLSIDEAQEIGEKASLIELANLLRVCLHGDHPIPKAGEGETTKLNPTIGANGSTSSATEPAGHISKSAS